MKNRLLNYCLVSVCFLSLTAQAQTTFTNGLVAYWNFDGTLLDSVGVFHGTPRGSAPIPFVDGKTNFGKAIKLNGDDQFVEVTGGQPDDLAFVGGSMSIAGWFKVDAFDTSWQALIAKGEGSNWRVHRRGAEDGLAHAGGIGEGPAGASVNDGLWHHFAAISDASVGTALYVDGLQYSVNAVPPSLASNGRRVMIGENPDARSREWEGLIDDIAIWDRVLTTNEIATLYAGGPGKPLGTLLGADTKPPVLVEALTAGNPNGVLVVFNEPVSLATATNKNNYTVDNGVTVNSVSPGVLNSNSVVVNTTPITPGRLYTITVSGVQDLAGNTLAANSKAQFYQVDGFIERRVFDVSGGNLPSITNSAKFINNLPDAVTYPTLFEGPVNYRDNYGTQFRGYITPPTNGNYAFFISSDDNSNLFLSTDENPANKKLIAIESVWSNTRQWNTSGGASDLTAKRSDQYAGSAWMPPNVITLVGGRRYYIEAIQAEGGGGDNIAVTWTTPLDAGDPLDGDSPIPGKYLSGFGFTPGPVNITTQPTNVAVLEPLQARFTVVPGGTPPYFYQWFRDGNPIAGAVNQSYTLLPTKAADNGAKFKVQVSNPFSTVTSSEATLSVSPDLSPPTLYRAVGSPGLNEVTVTFDEAIGAGGTNIANYSISGLTISAARFGGVLGTGGTNIILTTSLQTTGTVYTVTVSNVQDLAGKTLVPNPTVVRFTGFTLQRGAVLHKYFANNPANNIPGLTNRADFPNNPTFTTLEPLFEYPPNGGGEGGENYGNQLTGWLQAPVSGNYIFFICSDDPGRLFLSTDENPANKKLIAQESSWSNARSWNTPGGGTSTVEEKRSDSFAGSEWTPTPNVITLTAGKLYYIEAIHTEGGGGDDVGVAWTLPGGTDPANGALPISATNVFTYLNPDVSTVTIAITSPTNNATFAAGANIPITVSATDPNGPIRRVDIFAGANQIASITNSPYTFTWNNVAQGRYSLTAKALDRYGYVVTSAAVRIIVGNPPPFIYFVTADPGPLTFAGDIAVYQRLLNRGFDVELAQGSAVPNDGSTALGHDLIIQSSSLGSGTVENADPAGGPPISKFKFLAIPAIEWEASSEDAFGFQELNGTATAADQTQINIVNATNALAAGFPNGLVTVVTAVQPFSQGTPTGAHIVATPATDPSQAVIYYYEKGETGFNNFVMPARRVFYYFGDATASVLTADGLKLFDAAVDWAINKTVTTLPVITSARLSSGNITVQWTGGGTLESAPSLAAPITWTTTGNSSGSFSEPATGTKYYRVKK